MLPEAEAEEEKQELAALPERIETLEAERDALGAQLADPKTYQEAAESAGALTDAFNAAEAAIASSYARWEELESQG